MNQLSKKGEEVHQKRKKKLDFKRELLSNYVKMKQENVLENKKINETLRVVKIIFY